jgi:uncharacterized protein
VNVAITGASGLIGTQLRQRLASAGHAVRPISRAELMSDAVAQPLADADALVHLAGEPIAQRWTPAARQRIHDSRVESTSHLADVLASQPRRVRVLVCASAVGYYGSRGDEILTENSTAGSDFLARLVVDWEEAAQKAEVLGIRVVRLRFGMVLGDGGALARLLPVFRYGLGGRLGSGRQWMAWIHVQDAVNMILFALQLSAIRGALNATAPHPVTNDEFTSRLATALHRPAIFMVPGFALKLALGEMSTVLLGSQRVIPSAAKSAGFPFQYPDLHTALESLLR